MEPLRLQSRLASDRAKVQPEEHVWRLGTLQLIQELYILQGHHTTYSLRYSRRAEQSDESWEKL